MDTTGIILTGGQSTRFGEDKSLYIVNGKPMFQHVYDALEKTELCDRIVISTNKYLNHHFTNYETIIDLDKYESIGPLGGLLSVIEKYPNNRYAIFSCDIPYINTDWMKVLIETSKRHPNHLIITEDNQFFHPTIAVYQHEALYDTILEQVKRDDYKLKIFINKLPTKQLNIEALGFDNDTLKNVNYKSDLS